MLSYKALTSASGLETHTLTIGTAVEILSPNQLATTLQNIFHFYLENIVGIKIGENVLKI